MWSLPTLASGSSRTFSVVVKVTERTGTLQALATTWPLSSYDPNPSNNSAALATRVMSA
jgi:hypothetical protein